VLFALAATTGLADGLALLQEHRAGLELLRLALLDARTPYAGPIEAVCALLPGPSPTDVAAAKALARNGPPHEQVGLELAPFPTGGTR
jgi:nitrate reductase delta subunit